MKATITTTGSGSAEHAPDAMVLRVAAATTAMSVTSALQTVADLVALAGEAARSTHAGVTVASTGMSVWQRHGNDGNPMGFEARHSLRIGCPVLDRAGRVVDALSEALGDGFVLEGIEPRISDPERLAVEARARAFADAEAKAEELASLAGVALGKVVQIVEGVGGGGPGPVLAAKAMAADTAFEPGTQSVAAGLSVTWRVKG